MPTNIRNFRLVAAMSVPLALVPAACGGSSATGSAAGAPSATSASTEPESVTTFDFEEDLLVCTPGSTPGVAATAPTPCPESGSLAAAIRERVRSTYGALGSSCGGHGRVTIRLSIGADGVALGAEAVSNELDPTTTSSLLDALRAVAYCPSRDGASIVVNYPILVQPAE